MKVKSFVYYDFIETNRTILQPQQENHLKYKTCVHVLVPMYFD